MFLVITPTELPVLHGCWKAVLVLILVPVGPKAAAQRSRSPGWWELYLFGPRLTGSGIGSHPQHRSLVLLSEFWLEP